MSDAPTGSFVDDFDGSELDTSVWVPSYLPMWSSRRDSAATYAVADSQLRLSIPLDQGLWCAGDHEPALRVSGVQSGVFSGPVGSSIGQQPFRDGLVVKEFQPTQWGWTPHFGRIEVRARMGLSPRSMASAWLVGLEDQPDRSGEICVFEVFGNTLGADGDRSAAVGCGIHPFRDPALSEEFGTTQLPIDVAQFHTYTADWRPGRVDFGVDGEHLRTVHQAPSYPMQLMIGVFDFPAGEPPATHVPTFDIDVVRGEPRVAP